jgi:hypothetical protein
MSAEKIEPILTPAQLKKVNQGFSMSPKNQSEKE